jgi:hypothetical protein
MNVGGLGAPTIGFGQPEPDVVSNTRGFAPRLGDPFVPSSVRAQLDLNEHYEPRSPGHRETNDVVYSLTVFDGDLIAGGIFTEAGDTSASYIARWDGFEWTPLASGIGCVQQ